MRVVIVIRRVGKRVKVVALLGGRLVNNRSNLPGFLTSVVFVGVPCVCIYLPDRGFLYISCFIVFISCVLLELQLPCFKSIVFGSFAMFFVALVIIVYYIWNFFRRHGNYY